MPVPMHVHHVIPRGFLIMQALRFSKSSLRYELRNKVDPPNI